MKKTRAGIKTLYGEFNLGNKLQNYAVVYNLKKLGYEVTTLQYQTKARNFLVRIKSHAKSLIKLVLSVLPFVSRWNAKEFVNDKKRSKEFKKFSYKYLNVSRPMTKFRFSQQYIDSFEYIFLGSDQVWNEEFLDKEDLEYFLGLNDRAHTIGLSGSFGISKISNNHIKIYEKGFRKMKAISVREEAGADIVYELIDTKPIVLIDPVMSLSRKEWCEVSKPPRMQLPNSYVLCYLLGDKTIYQKQIEKYSKHNNLTIIDIMDKKMEYYLSGPSEFLHLVNNADFICTDSFHGCVFSLIFNKPFQAFERIGKGNNMSSRISTLLDTFDCDHARCDTVKKREFDWDSINRKIEIEKEKFFNFLNSNTK